MTADRDPELGQQSTWSARLKQRWQRRADATERDWRSKPREDPGRNRRITDPSGRKFEVRAVANGENVLRPRPTRLIGELIAETAIVFVQGAYRSIRRTPRRSDCFTVAVVHETAPEDRVVYTESVARESDIAAVVEELVARTEAGDFSES